jgi:hypothetical protein
MKLYVGDTGDTGDDAAGPGDPRGDDDDLVAY